MPKMEWKNQFASVESNFVSNFLTIGKPFMLFLLLYSEDIDMSNYKDLYVNK